MRTRLFWAYSSGNRFHSLPAWRCVNCGDVFDLVILQHRGFMARGVSNWLELERVCAAVVRGRAVPWSLPLFPEGALKPS